MSIRHLAVILALTMSLCSKVYPHGLPDFTHLIEQSALAVVKIDTLQRGDGGVSHGVITDPPHDLFQHRRTLQGEARSTGSGFSISNDGYVLTNYHVVEGAEEVVVRLIDRREFKATIVGVDSRSDLALLKIDAENLPYIKFAEPGTLKVGSWVLAIGFPFDLDYSASVGIVSGIGRSLPTEKGESYVPFIQSDVAINPGHSGGPLLNLDGHAVGVNSKIFTRSGGSMGVSFAVPSSIAKGVVDQLKQSGQVDRGWLGVFIQDVDRDLARSLGLDQVRGALVAQVVADGPADRAGIMAGDVIVRLNDRDILNSDELPQMVGLVSPGSTIAITLIRSGATISMEVVVGSLSSAARPHISKSSAPDKLGLIVGVVNDSPINPWRRGVRIKSISKDSPAFRAGLSHGDIIVQMNFNNIDGIEQYRNVLKTAPNGQPLALRLVRDGVTFSANLQVEQ